MTPSWTPGHVHEPRHPRYQRADRHRHRPLPGELAISTAEFGVLVAPDRARAGRLRRLSAIQRRFDPLPVDEAVADSYALLAARVVAVGRQPGARLMDLLIAATARDATVYTRNAADLAGLDDLITVATV